MRRNRRGGGSGLEFGGSGEDSFVAVVVTKLTGALLFILLLTMVIMALLPKAGGHGAGGSAELSLGHRCRGRSTHDYHARNVARAIAGASLHHPCWLLLEAAGRSAGISRGSLPEGLVYDPASGVLQGTPSKGTPQPVSLALAPRERRPFRSQPDLLASWSIRATDPSLPPHSGSPGCLQSPESMA